MYCQVCTDQETESIKDQGSPTPKNPHCMGKLIDSVYMKNIPESSYIVCSYCFLKIWVSKKFPLKKCLNGISLKIAIIIIIKESLVKVQSSFPYITQKS